MIHTVHILLQHCHDIIATVAAVYGDNVLMAVILYIRAYCDIIYYDFDGTVS
jgi:hypothetical protein